MFDWPSQMPPHYSLAEFATETNYRQYVNNQAASLGEWNIVIRCKDWN